MLERAIERRFGNEALKRGWGSIKLDPTFSVGIPDRMILLGHGRVAFVEFKAPGCHPSKAQQSWLERLRAAGYPCAVCDSVDSALEFCFDLLGVSND